MDPKKFLKNNIPQGKSPFKLKIKINLWTIAITLMVIFFVLPVVITGFQMTSTNKVEISQLMGDIKDNKVDKVLIENSKLIVTYKDGSTKFSTKEDAQSFSDLLEKSKIDPANVKFTVLDQSTTKVFGDIAGIVLPLLLMAAFFFFIMRAQSKGAQDVFSFGRSKAKLLQR